MKRVEVLEAVSGFAHAQRGLFTRAEVNPLGVTDSDLERLSGQDVERVEYGVWRFRWSPPVAHEGTTAALLSLEPTIPLWEHQAPHRIAVSHLSAAGLWSIGNMAPRRYEFTVTSGLRSNRETIVLHHGNLPDSDVTTIDAMPVTTLERTLVDIAVTEAVDPSHFGDMVADAVLRGLDVSSLESRLSGAGARYSAADSAAIAGRHLQSA